MSPNPKRQLALFLRLQLPGWEQADPQMIAATEDLAALLGEQCFEVSLPDLDEVAAIRERINFAEMAKMLLWVGAARARPDVGQTEIRD